MCQRPLTRLFSHRPYLSHPSQYRKQPHWRQGRLRACCHPERDDDLQPQVRRHPIVFAFLSAPIDTPPSHSSLANNQLCGIDYWGHGTYTTDGIAKLCERLKGSAVTSLKCAAAQ